MVFISYQYQRFVPFQFKPNYSPGEEPIDSEGDTEETEVSTDW